MQSRFYAQFDSAGKAYAATICGKEAVFAYFALAWSWHWFSAL
jgi:hypothetical protein